jgi:hypothetical protein
MIHSTSCLGRLHHHGAGFLSLGEERKEERESRESRNRDFVEEGHLIRSFLSSFSEGGVSSSDDSFYTKDADLTRRPSQRSKSAEEKAFAHTRDHLHGRIQSEHHIRN